jgi:hypothetical protein
MRFILALVSADQNHYATSDYRKLVQKLFVEGRLREDVALISFNYDPYLEFRLYRAFGRRSDLKEYSPEDKSRLQNAIHSGLSTPQDLEWLNLPGFCHLKLHGAAVFPWTPRSQPNDFTAADFFGQSLLVRLSRVCNTHGGEAVPALLPWEIVHEDGKILEKQAFEKAVGEDWQYVSLYPCFVVYGSGHGKRYRRLRKSLSWESP